MKASPVAAADETEKSPQTGYRPTLVEANIIDPLVDRRWAELAADHPKASIFHQTGWIEALVRTYGYRPFVITTTPAGAPLRDGILLCHVSSWLTGTRAVSLPFSDHCEPLVSGAAFTDLANWLVGTASRERWKYVELRPTTWNGSSATGFSAGQTYWTHKVDLRQSRDQLFRALHKDSIQRKIRRAEKEGVEYETGRSDHMLDEFYSLMSMTRGRHQLPPQPKSWFKNVLECMPETALLRLARKGGTPIAAILSVRHRASVVYKYGCSDEKFHHLGGMPFLLWKLIEESQASGADELDLGRSDPDQDGLITFKDRFGSSKTSLTYYRYPPPGPSTASILVQRSVRRFVGLLPKSLLPVAGRMLYRHMG